MPSTPTTRAAFRPRLDMTLVAFAAAGAAVALLMPQRAPSEGRYALAISHGEDLRLADAAAAGGAQAASALPDPATRVLACRRVVSVGPVDVGARCRPGEAKPLVSGQATAAAD